MDRLSKHKPEQSKQKLPAQQRRANDVDTPFDISELLADPARYGQLPQQQQQSLFPQISMAFGGSNSQIQRFLQASTIQRAVATPDIEEEEQEIEEEEPQAEQDDNQIADDMPPDDGDDSGDDASGDNPPPSDQNQAQSTQQQAVQSAVQTALAGATGQTDGTEDKGDGNADKASPEKGQADTASDKTTSGQEAQATGQTDDDKGGDSEEKAPPEKEQADKEAGQTSSGQEAQATGDTGSETEAGGEAGNIGGADVALVSPEPPVEHPEVQQGIATASSKMGDKAEAEKALPPASENVEDARNTVEQPAEELEGRGQQDFASSVIVEPAPSPEIIELGERIKQAIKDQRPVDEDELGKANPKEMADNAGHEVDSNIRGEVTDVQGGYDNLDDSEPAKASQKPEAQKAQPDATSTEPVKAEEAAPEPNTEEELDLSADVEASEQQMEEAGMMTEPAKLVESGPVAEARGAKDEFTQFAETEPANVVAQQQEISESSKVTLQDLQASAYQRLETSRDTTTTDVSTQQVDMKGSEEEIRAQVGQQAQEIYDSAQQRVNEILEPLSQVAMEQWDNGVAQLSERFEASLARVDEWIEERHSDDLAGAATELWDDLTGLPGWITDEYDRAEKAFGDGIVQLLYDISTYVNTEVANCQTIIKQARDEIKALYDSLPQELQGWAQQQQAEFNQRLDQLNAEALSVRDNFNQQISEQATQAVAEVQQRVSELREAAKGLLGKLADAVGAFLENPAKFIIDGLLELIGIAANAFWGVVERIGSAIDSIAEDPINFVNNLVGALSSGFEMFFDNIKDHLMDGLFSWLFSRLAEAGVNAPEDFSMESIITFFLEVMGFTWDKIKSMIAKHIGEENMEMIEQAYDLIADLIEMGPAGIFELIKDQLDPGAILDMILQTAIDFVVETLIKQVAMRLLGMLNPAGAILQAIEAIYKVLQWLFENAARIFSLIETVVSGISDIIAGNISGMAQAIDLALSSLLPIVIDFLADYLGLGDLPKKIAKAVQGIQDRVESVMDKVISWIAEKAKKIMDKLGFGDDDDADAENADAGQDEGDKEGDENLDDKQQTAVNMLKAESKKHHDAEGDIEKAEAEAVASKTQEKYADVFSSVTVVDGGATWQYDYQLVQRAKINAGSKEEEIGQPDNYEQIKGLLGHPVADHKKTLESLNYVVFVRDNSYGIRRKDADDKKYQQLSVDEEGYIKEGASTTRSISKESEMRKNLGPAKDSYNRHHLIPVAIVISHRLTQEAMERGQPIYQVDNAGNLVYLPSTYEEWEAQDGLNSGFPMHKGSHPKWNEEARTVLDEEETKLLQKEGKSSVSECDSDKISKAVDYAQRRLKMRIKTWSMMA